MYNRLRHTQQTIESLKGNAEAHESDLFIFSDGAKSNADLEKIERLRDYLKTISGFKSITLIERKINHGLAKSIIDGITKILKDNETVIVIEDDIVTSPFFLQYMNNALMLYEKENTVISIHGYVYPVREKLPETFFMRGADCWGWATWRRGWQLFEPNGKKLLKELEQKGLVKEFDFNGSYGYKGMLKKQIDGKNNSWAIRWYASAFLKEKLTLYPGRSLVKNIGNDNSGTHSRKTEAFQSEIANQPIELNQIDVIENKNAKSVIESYFKANRPWWIRWVGRIL